MNVRSKRLPDSGVASGYQADLGAGYWGCLYDEARRNRMLAQAAAPALRENDWNDYRILCQGRRIQLWVNGIPTVDFTEPDENVRPVGSSPCRFRPTARRKLGTAISASNRWIDPVVDSERRATGVSPPVFHMPDICARSSQYPLR